MHPFDEYDLELQEKAKAEMAKEEAAWAALPEDEKLRIIAQREAAKLFEGLDVTNQDDEDDEDDEEEDE